MLVAGLIGQYGCCAEEPTTSAEQMAQLLHLRARAPAASFDDQMAELTVVRHMRRLGESPINLGMALRKGIEAIQAGILHFQKDPPEITEGISTMGISLLEALDLVLTDEGKAAWPGYDNFAKSWTALFQKLPATLNDVAENMKLFASTGKSSHLIDAVRQILDEGAQVVSLYASSSVGREITKYLGSLKEAMASLARLSMILRKARSPMVLKISISESEGPPTLCCRPI